MDQFCIFIKTYSGDLFRTLILLESIAEFNRDNIPIVMSVPQNDYKIFKSKIESSIKLFRDNEICDELVYHSVNGFAPGYINQQLVKLTFWKTNLYKFYLCLDSDTYFIRDFYYRDFFYNSETPYTNLSQWEPHFLNIDHLHWVDIYKTNIKKINEVLDHKIDKYITCSGLTILSYSILKSFEKKFLQVKSLKYLDIIKKVPFEFTWYNQWLIKEGGYKIVPITNFFKVFHYRDEYEDTRHKLIKEKDIKKMYLGIVMNSNWKPIPAPYKYKDPSWRHYLLYYCTKFLKQVFAKIYKISHGIKK